MKKIETTSAVLLRHHLKALKLPTMTAECEKVAARCAKENVDHLGFLLQLAELELLERERRAAARRLKAARFPTPKGLDAFDFAAAPSVNKPMVLELMRCEFIDRRENVLLIGGSGSGKTHLATALAMEACGRGKRVRFYRVTELATQLLEAREERQLSRLRSQLAKLDLLILDELGYVPASKTGAELLFDVISTAYERSSVIVTTNLPFEEWKEVLGSERLTGATLDRLTHRCTIMETGKESYRLRATPAAAAVRGHAPCREAGHSTPRRPSSNFQKCGLPRSSADQGLPTVSSPTVTSVEARATTSITSGTPNASRVISPHHRFSPRSKTLAPRRFLRKAWLCRAFETLRDECVAQGLPYPGDSTRPPDIHGEFVPTGDFFDPGSNWPDRLERALESTCNYRDEAARALAYRSPLSPEEISDGMTPASILQEIRGLETGSQDALQPGLAHSLAEAGFFPMFGMPTRVRNLYLNHKEKPGRDMYSRTWSTIDRDIDLGVFEHAPGAIVVKDKHQHRCIGFTGPLGDFRFGMGKAPYVLSPYDTPLSDPFWMIQCEECGSWSRFDSKPDEGNCPSCSAAPQRGGCWRVPHSSGLPDRLLPKTH